VVAVVVDQHDQIINCGVWIYNNEINNQEHVKRFLEASLMQILDCLCAPLISYTGEGLGWKCTILEALPCTASEAFMLCTEYLVTLLWEQDVLPVVGSVEAMPFLGKPCTILAQMLMKDSSREFTTKPVDLALYSGLLDDMVKQIFGTAYIAEKLSTSPLVESSIPATATLQCAPKVQCTLRAFYLIC
jgi:hypothetical protein